MTAFLDLERVLRQVGRMGFLVRDAGLIASAVARPRTTVFGEDAYPTIWLKAAALMQSTDHNQAVIDGNKRLAWVATALFLDDNGYDLRADADAGERFMLDVVAGGADLVDIASWLESHSAERTA